MEKQFLEHVIVDAVGKQALPVLDMLYGKKNVNEFLIAKKLNLTINQTRNLLYKLSDIGVVSSTRKKDKRKGWFTYFWTLEISKSFVLLEQLLEKKQVEIEGFIRLHQKNRFYICEQCHIEIDEEQGLLQNFICQECGSVLSLKDDSKVIAELQKQKAKIVSDLIAIKVRLADGRATLARKMVRTANKAAYKKAGKKKPKKKPKKTDKKLNVKKVTLKKVIKFAKKTSVKKKRA